MFVPNVEGEWIHPERATPDEVATLALNCPSGAITYERFDGVENERAPLVIPCACARTAARIPWRLRGTRERCRLSRHFVPLRCVQEQTLV